MNPPLNRIALLLICFCVLSWSLSAAQDPYKVNLDLKYSSNDSGRTVTLKVTRMEGDQVIPVKWAIVNLYLNEITKLGMLGNITTDANGTGIIPLDKKFSYLIDSLKIHTFRFIGSLQNNPGIEPALKELVIRDAELRLELYAENSVRKIKSTLKVKNADQKTQPSEGAKVFLKLKNTTGETLHDFGSHITGKNGEMIFELPSLKNYGTDTLIVVAQTDSTSEFGELTSTKITPWHNGNANLFTVRPLLIFVLFLGAITFLFLWLRSRRRNHSK